MNESIKGIFFCIGKDGKPTDEGIVDEMLEDEDEITRQLIAAGIIKDMFMRTGEEDAE